MLVYRIDILEELKKIGYTTYKLQKEAILNASTLGYLRSGKMIGTKNLDTICNLLNCQPGDLIEFVRSD